MGVAQTCCCRQESTERSDACKIQVAPSQTQCSGTDAGALEEPKAVKISDGPNESAEKTPETPGQTLTAQNDEAEERAPSKEAEESVVYSQIKRCESKEEHDFSMNRELSNRVIARLKGLSAENAARRSSTRMSTRWSQADSNRRITMLSTQVMDGKGLILSFPMTFEQAEMLRTHYCKFGPTQLHRAVVDELVLSFTFNYQQKYPLSVVEIPAFEYKFNVIGDTHGQLQDVLYMFHRFGPPSARNVYLFNGDISDRGPNACEIWFLLFAYFLADPDSVIINRGNHEDEDMNSMEASCGGGFRGEVIEKFDIDMYYTFLEMMKTLPLCTLIGRKVFVVHGGISYRGDDSFKLTIDFIKSIDHTEMTMPDMNSTVLQDIIWNDMLWSDPSEEKGQINSTRGSGVKFGPDITDKFLNHNFLIELIVRSHELPAQQKGFQKHHQGKVITIFSASNYCGTSGNTGAVMTFERLKFPQYNIREYFSPTLEKIADLVDSGADRWDQVGETLRQQQNKMAEAKWWPEELSKLMVAIVEKKPQIWSKFQEVTGGTPLVTKDTWRSVLSDAVGSNWHWGRAWDTWRLQEHGDEKKGEDKKVNFPDFLRRFNVVIGKSELTSFKFSTIARVFEAIMHSHSSLEQTLRMFDQDGNGKVSLTEMRNSLKALNLGLAEAQVSSLLHVFFREAEEIQGVRKIEVKAFLGRFAMVYRHAEDAIHRGNRSAEQRDAQDAMCKIGHLIAATNVSKIKEALAKAQKGGASARKKTKKKTDATPEGGNKGKMEKSSSERGSPRNEKASADGKMEKAVSEKGSARMEKAVSEKGSARMDKAVSGKGSPRMDKAVSEKRDQKKIDKNTYGESTFLALKMEKLFELLDGDNNGYVEADEFVNGMALIPGVLDIILSSGEKLTVKKLQFVTKFLGKGGMISVMEFLESFCYEDRDGVADALAEHMVSVLFRYRHAMRAGARFLDDGNSRITRDAFLQVLQSLNGEITDDSLHFSQSQMEDLSDAVCMEIDGSRMVEYEEFLDSFEIVDAENSAATVRLSSKPKDTKKE